MKVKSFITQRFEPPGSEDICLELTVHKRIAPARTSMRLRGNVRHPKVTCAKIVGMKIYSIDLSQPEHLGERSLGKSESRAENKS